MTTSIARIRRILTGHSARALVQAVDREGLEYKLEVPVEATRTAREGDVLVLTWSIHSLPPLSEAEPVASKPEPTSGDAPATAPLGNADARFDALMRSRRIAVDELAASGPVPTTNRAEDASQVAETIARRLGLVIR